MKSATAGMLTGTWVPVTGLSTADMSSFEEQANAALSQSAGNHFTINTSVAPAIVADTDAGHSEIAVTWVLIGDASMNTCGDFYCNATGDWSTITVMSTSSGFVGADIREVQDSTPDASAVSYGLGPEMTVYEVSTIPYFTYGGNAAHITIDYSSAPGYVASSSPVTTCFKDQTLLYLADQLATSGVQPPNSDLISSAIVASLGWFSSYDCGGVQQVEPALGAYYHDPIWLLYPIGDSDQSVVSAAETALTTPLAQLASNSDGTQEGISAEVNPKVEPLAAQDSNGTMAVTFSLRAVPSKSANPSQAKLFSDFSTITVLVGTGGSEPVVYGELTQVVLLPTDPESSNTLTASQFLNFPSPYGAGFESGGTLTQDFDNVPGTGSQFFGEPQVTEAAEFFSDSFENGATNNETALESNAFLAKSALAVTRTGEVASDGLPLISQWG